MGTWQHWVNFVVGIWVIVSAYVVSSTGMVTNLVVSGIIIAVLALWGALSSQSSAVGSLRT